MSREHGECEQSMMGAPICKTSRFSPRDTVTAAAVASIGVVSCGASGDLSDAIVRAVVFNLAGGLALFMIGLKLMSDGMHSVSGGSLQRFIKTLTQNRFAALLVGGGITALIQSSSVTTVLALGLVDGGLMSLTQALGVVFGANIGTTVTTWIAALKIAKYGLPIVGFSGLAYVFAKEGRLKNISQAVLGLGLVFLGLTTMSAGFADPSIKAYLTDFFSTMRDPSYLGILRCIAVGAAVTAIVQSSSVTTVITMALAKTGIIPFEAAAGLVLGANIGTTVTAGLAALRPDTKTEARRVALAHLLFNVLGVALIFPFSPQFINASKSLGERIPFIGSDVGMQVAFIHTFYNVVASLFFLAILTPFERVVRWMTPEKTAEEVGHGQRRLSRALLPTPEFALQASHRVISRDMNERVDEMFQYVLAAMTMAKSADEIEQAVRSREEDLDQYQRNLYRWFNRLGQGEISSDMMDQLQAQRHITGQGESMGDHLLKLLLTIQKDRPAELPEEAQKYLVYIHQSTLEHFLLISHAVDKNDPTVWSQVKVENDRLKELIAQHEDYVPEDASTASQIFYHDAMALYRELLGNIKNMAEALAGLKWEKK